MSEPTEAHRLFEKSDPDAETREISRPPPPQNTLAPCPKPTSKGAGKGPMADCISDVQQFLRERSDEQGGLPVTPNKNDILQAASILRSWAGDRQRSSGRWTSQEQAAVECAVRLEDSSPASTESVECSLRRRGWNLCECNTWVAPHHRKCPHCDNAIPSSPALPLPLSEETKETDRGIKEPSSDIEKAQGPMELLACPFCGSGDVSFPFEDRTNYWVTCNDCEADGPPVRIGEHNPETRAKIRWNRRSEPESENARIVRSMMRVPTVNHPPKGQNEV